MAGYHNDSYRKLARVILGRFESARKKDDPSKLQFAVGLEVLEWKMLLKETVRLDPSIPEHETERIVSSALSDAGRSGRLDDSTFETALKLQERAYLSRPLRKYALLTQISIAKETRLAGSRIDGISISLSDRAPTALANARRSLERSARQSVVGELPGGYKWVKVTLRERSPVAAGERALESLDLLRASWNLLLNTGKRNRFTFIGPRKPVNSILLGPIHTVHPIGGGPSHDGWWYDASYCGQAQVADLANQSKRLDAFANRVRRRLSKCPYRDQLVLWFRFYSRALDERDHSSSYLKLWQMIEAATLADNYKTAIRRTSRLYRDEDLHLNILDHLRNVRNQYVHAGKERSTIENHLFMLKGYAEQLLLFHLRWSAQLRSREEAIEFLDLPSSQGELLRQVRLRKAALRFHS